MRTERSPAVRVPAARRGAPVAALVAVLAVAIALGAFVLTRDGERAGDAATPPSASSPRPTEPTSTTSPDASSEPTPSTSALPPASPSASARAVAVGRGRPSCGTGPCQVQHRLTRSFLPQYGGQQTLLLARSEKDDDAGNFLHAFLVDAEGRVLWQEHAFGWEWRPADDRFAIRFDEAQHVFFRAYVADNTYVYVLDTSGKTPRLIGPDGRRGTEGFANAEILEVPGEPAFAIRELLSDCPDPDSCTTKETRYRWNGRAYVAD